MHLGKAGHSIEHGNLQRTLISEALSASTESLVQISASIIVVIGLDAVVMV